MTNILILGANGRIARIVERRLLAETDAHLTLVLRRSARLTIQDSTRETVVEGDAGDSELLARVLPHQDVVYANLNGQMTRLARALVPAMQFAKVAQLIWVTGSGLYHETPEPFGSWVEQVVGHASKEDTRRAAAVIEASDLQYTLIRAAFMTDFPEIDYELTQKGEVFRGTMVSRTSIADLIVRIIASPTRFARTSLGIAQPGTDNDLERIKSMI
ncbi:NAD(P)H-binding protein [Levilactobacillus sp. N40-8-2]|uniref:NAD(P)H-binding protein n=1 Tax=Levilactobacillus muriae TaxID=3238987 RepID=UPI0038B2DC56